jgi:hypothetical protein
MSDSKLIKTVKGMFGDLGPPPTPDMTRGNLATPAPVVKEKSDRTEQLNLRVPPSLKRTVRLLAARDDISLSEVVVRSIALYEERYGRAPDL